MPSLKPETRRVYQIDLRYERAFRSPGEAINCPHPMDGALLLYQPVFRASNTTTGVGPTPALRAGPFRLAGGCSPHAPLLQRLIDHRQSDACSRRRGTHRHQRQD
jgi:hypothetical protein